MISRWVLMAGTLMLIAGSAQAASSFLPLTPATLSSSRLGVSISVSGTAKSEQFCVTVKPMIAIQEGSVGPNVEAKIGIRNHFVKHGGWLEDERFAGQGKSFPCPVIVTEQGKGITIYRFTLPARYLARARFYFGYYAYDTGKGVMPSGNFYWFMPSAFVHPRAGNRKHSKAAV